MYRSPPPPPSLQAQQDPSQPQSSLRYIYKSYLHPYFIRPLLPTTYILLATLTLILSIFFTLTDLRHDKSYLGIMIPIVFYLMFMILLSFCVSVLQYLPQLLKTYMRGPGRMGSLSGVMMGVQAPLVLVWGVFLFYRCEGLSPTLLCAKHVVWGLQSGALAWVCWEVRKGGEDGMRSEEREGGEEGEGAAVPSPRGGNEQADEETPLLS